MNGTPRRRLSLTSHYGFVHAEPRDDAPTVSDIVAGDRLLLKGRKGRFYEVEYPDGRKGYVALADAKPEAEWRASLRHDAAAITATAQTLTGRTLPLGRHIVQRRGLQRLRPHGTLHARHHHPARRLAAGPHGPAA